MGQEEVQCPFCKDFGFDLKGLKMHINNNWCPEWDKADDDEEETRRQAIIEAARKQAVIEAVAKAPRMDDRFTI